MRSQEQLHKEQARFATGGFGRTKRFFNAVRTRREATFPSREVSTNALASF